MSGVRLHLLNVDAPDCRYTVQQCSSTGYSGIFWDILGYIGAYVLSEGFASDGRKASRRSTNQNVAGSTLRFISTSSRPCGGGHSRPPRAILYCAQALERRRRGHRSVRLERARDGTAVGRKIRTGTVKPVAAGDSILQYQSDTRHRGSTYQSRIRLPVR